MRRRRWRLLISFVIAGMWRRLSNYPSKSVAIMDAYLAENGYENDLSDRRLHHEIYMSDARKVTPEKWKTVIRHPIRKQQI